MQAQARAAIEEADAILFVVDGQAGLLPEDAELARALRKRPEAPRGRGEQDRHAAAMRRASASSTRSASRCCAASRPSTAAARSTLLEELVAELPAGAEAPPSAAPELRVAILGRPNAGKSSLLNRLLGAERVVVSELPGTTRDAVDIRVEHEGAAFVFVDTAGLRRPGRRDRVGERGGALMALRALEEADVALVLIDAADGPTEQDVRILSLVAERGRAAAVVLNKWDLVAGERASASATSWRARSRGSRTSRCSSSRRRRAAAWRASSRPIRQLGEAYRAGDPDRRAEPLAAGRASRATSPRWRSAVRASAR